MIKRELFSVANSSPDIDIQVACEVSIEPSKTGEVLIEIDASHEDLANFQVWRHGGVVYIRQSDYASASSSVTIAGDLVMGNIYSGDRNVVIGGNGGSFISSGRGNVTIISGGRNVQISNGRVIVDGQDVTTGNAAPATDCQLPKIRIEVPSCSNLIADLAGQANLYSTVDLGDVSISTQHSAKVQIKKALSADIDTSNGSSVSVDEITGGNLIVNTSNGSDVRVRGRFTSCQAVASNGSSIVTSGTCTGSYNATGNNGSSIRHVGTVLGRIREKANNAASVNIG